MRKWFYLGVLFNFFIHHYSVGEVDLTAKLVLEYWNFKEFDSKGDEFISNSGFIPGIDLGFRLNLDRFWWSSTFSIVRGETKYEGAVVELDTGESIPLELDFDINTLADFETKIGVKCSPKISLYTGIGYYYYRDDEEKEIGFDYKRVTKYITLPVGIEIEHRFTKKILLSHQFQMNLWINANNKTKLSDIVAEDDLGRRISFDDFQANQESGFGLKYEGTITAFTDQSFEYVSSFYLKFWKVDDSERRVVNQYSDGVMSRTREFLEPQSETISVGVKFGVLY